MANTKTQKPAQDNVGIGEIPAGHAITVMEDKVAHIAEQYNDERDLANQILGQIEMASTFSKLLTVTTLSKLQHIKEHKLYRALKGRKSPDGSEFSGTWADYCALIGRSVDSVDEDIRNLNTFGEDALESLTRIGAGYRDLRKLRRLPEDIRQQVAGQLVDLGDKEEIVALIDDLSAKHAREKDALVKENTDLKADAEATDKVLGDKSAKLDALEKEIHKLRNKSGDWHPRVFEIAMENTRVLGLTMEGLDRLDTLRDVILNEEFGEQERDSAIEMMAVVYHDACNQIMGRLAEIMHACDAVFIGYKEKARPMLQVLAEAKGE